MKKNPFIVAGKIPSEYFCPRKKEAEQLKTRLINGNNVVLISERRIGKTALIANTLEKKDFKNNYQVVSLDLLHTTGLSEFVLALSKEVFESLLPRGKKVLLDFICFLKSIRLQFSIDPRTGMPTFSLELGQIEVPETTLKELFDYLEKEEKPVIVVFDEFQQIGRYETANVEALLRSHIQRLKNVNFVFSGSSKHMLQQMFLSSAHPFYRSADLIRLEAIPEDDYVRFASGLFRKNNREIDTDAIHLIYEALSGHTFYLQKILNSAFSHTDIGSKCTKKMIEDAFEEEITLNSVIYREILSSLSLRTKEVLYAIAKEGEAEHITSGDFVKRHKLLSPSSVQTQTRAMLERGIITRKEKKYTISDKFFSLWIRSEILGIH